MKDSADQVIPRLAEAMLRSGDSKPMVDVFAGPIPRRRRPRGVAYVTRQGELALRNVEVSKAAFALASPPFPTTARLAGTGRTAAGQGDPPGALASWLALAKLPTLVDGGRSRAASGGRGRDRHGAGRHRKVIAVKPDEPPRDT